MQKYTISASLGNVFQIDISNYNKSFVEKFEDQCSTYYYNDGSPTGSLTDVVNKLAEQYAVDEKPVCNARCICYKIANNGLVGRNAKYSIINKGDVIWRTIPVSTRLLGSLRKTTRFHFYTVPVVVFGRKTKK